IGGAYEMPDGRSFWIDAPVAREMARRVLAALASTPQPASAETVDRAVAAERERCAMIADTLYPEVSGWSAFHKKAARTIAAAIRQSAKGSDDA
ncbi:hypothetical protein, partial [Rhizorhabdus histidinilytica]|uniref:hypothetical protein n=1 Tax=Rhizorhabdus histidinilytica TaxID=439228 RepID=UPI001ADA45A4